MTHTLDMLRRQNAENHCVLSDSQHSAGFPCQAAANDPTALTYCETRPACLMSEALCRIVGLSAAVGGVKQEGPEQASLATG